MNRKAQKILKEKFFDSGLFVGAIAFSVFPVAKLLQDGDIIPLLINCMIILVALVFSVWAYLNRVKATAFLLGGIIRFSMLIAVLFVIQLSITSINNYCYWIFFSAVIMIVVMGLGLYSEMKIKEKRKTVWEECRKIDIKKGFFNILINPVVVYKSDKCLKFISLFTSIVPVFLLRFFKIIKINGIFVIVLTLMLAAVLAFYLAKSIGILFEVKSWQKKYGIVFKTEYRDFIKDK
ncbi:MAG: hypothetical protein PVG90_12715 [Bacillota bacterium]|jgi:hypothetical protein